MIDPEVLIAVLFAKLCGRIIRIILNPDIMKPSRPQMISFGMGVICTVCLALFFAGSPKPLSKFQFQEITIQECEYIFVDENPGNFRLYAITHKGNCRNKIHQCH